MSTTAAGVGITGDKAGRAIRSATVAAVAIVAGIAGWASYTHAVEVVRAHGETGMVASVYPATIDGLIFAASMVLLDSARRRIDAPTLAYWLLAAGIAATLAANLDSGIRYGWLGALVAAWPAPALVGSYELLMWLVRTAASGPAAQSERAALALPSAARARPAAAKPVLVNVVAAASGSAGPVISSGHIRQSKGKRRKVQTRLSPAQQDAAVVAALQSDPGASKAALAKLVGISERSVGRALQRLSTPQAEAG